MHNESRGVYVGGGGESVGHTGYVKAVSTMEDLCMYVIHWLWEVGGGGSWVSNLPVRD